MDFTKMFIEFLNTHLIAAKDPYGPVTVVFTMIFTAVLTYVISTAAMSGMATYSMLHARATPVSPPPQPVRSGERWGGCCV